LGIQMTSEKAEFRAPWIAVVRSGEDDEGA
jgi:hypothetical protein